MTLNESALATLLQGNLANLARKIKDGKTLSAREIELLTSAAGGEEPAGTLYAKNQAELAKLLKVDRKTITRWRKEPSNPGVAADGRCNVSAWRAFAQAKGKALGTGEDGEPDLLSLKARQLLLQNQKLETQIAVMRREYVSAEMVEIWGNDLGAEIKKVVQQLHCVAPSLAGLTVNEIEFRLREIEDEIMSKLHLLAQRMDGLKTDVEPA